MAVNVNVISTGKLKSLFCLPTRRQFARADTYGQAKQEDVYPSV